MIYTCPYPALLLELTRTIPRGEFFEVFALHDDWCTMVGGDGSRRCHPRLVTQDGTEVARLKEN